MIGQAGKAVNDPAHGAGGTGERALGGGSGAA